MASRPRCTADLCTVWAGELACAARELVSSAWNWPVTRTALSTLREPDGVASFPGGEVHRPSGRLQIGRLLFDEAVGLGLPDQFAAALGRFFPIIGSLVWLCRWLTRSGRG